ncbi:Tetratricopeptide Repeat Protein 39B [Manis pentadactyla]|nr:Tetratricopeptide Repeat Protein 39B [Manis pentadactyla]
MGADRADSPYGRRAGCAPGRGQGRGSRALKAAPRRPGAESGPAAPPPLAAVGLGRGAGFWGRVCVPANAVPISVRAQLLRVLPSWTAHLLYRPDLSFARRLVSWDVRPCSSRMADAVAIASL